MAKEWKELHIRIEKGLYEEIKKLAEDEGLNVTSFIRVVLNKRVKYSKRKRK